MYFTCISVIFMKQLCKCYANDLHTTTYSNVLDHLTKPGRGMREIIIGYVAIN
jgi:hypothetical protein